MFNCFSCAAFANLLYITPHNSHSKLIFDISARLSLITSSCLQLDKKEFAKHDSLLF